MPSFDERHVEKEGALSESDYNKFNSILVPKLSGVRIQPIRKALNWTPAEYDNHCANAAALQGSTAPITDPNQLFGITALPLSFHTEFTLDFFPEFSREYDLTMSDGVASIIAGSVHESADMVVLDASNFRSLLHAQYLLQQELKQRYKATTLARDISDDIEVEVSWGAPTKVAFNPGDTIRIDVDIILLK